MLIRRVAIFCDETNSYKEGDKNQTSEEWECRIAECKDYLSTLVSISDDNLRSITKDGFNIQIIGSKKR